MKNFRSQNGNIKNLITEKFYESESNRKNQVSEKNFEREKYYKKFGTGEIF